MPVSTKRHNTVVLAFFVSVPMLLSGCGSAEYASSIPMTEASAKNEATEASEIPALEQGLSFEVEDGNTSINGKPDLNRKIIYDTTIGLVVDDYTIFESKLPGLVSANGGFVASSDTDRRYNNRQSGNWVIRVPVAKYNDFLSGISSLGFAESRTENASDVTEEYVDVEARIKNKKSLETRIIAMLEERTGKLSDVLEIERELARIREEIERMEGRLRFLSNRTSLATITINCREQKQYQPAEAPTLASRINHSWGSSLGSIQSTAENSLVAFIAVIPWLIVLGIPLTIIYKLIRRKRRRSVATS